MGACSTRAMSPTLWHSRAWTAAWATSRRIMLVPDHSTIFVMSDYMRAFRSLFIPQRTYKLR